MQYLRPRVYLRLQDTKKCTIFMEVSRIIPDFCTCLDHDSAKYQSYQLAILMFSKRVYFINSFCLSRSQIDLKTFKNKISTGLDSRLTR